MSRGFGMLRSVCATVCILPWLLGSFWDGWCMFRLGRVGDLLTSTHKWPWEGACWWPPLGESKAYFKEPGIYIYIIYVCTYMWDIHLFAHEKPSSVWTAPPKYISSQVRVLGALVPTWKLGQMTGRCCPPGFVLAFQLSIVRVGGGSTMWYHIYMPKKTLVNWLIYPRALGIGSIIYLSYCINDEIYWNSSNSPHDRNPHSPVLKIMSFHDNFAHLFQGWWIPISKFCSSTTIHWYWYYNIDFSFFWLQLGGSTTTDPRHSNMKGIPFWNYGYPKPSVLAP